MSRVFDFHTHILPGMDDGSRDVGESLAILEELTRQGASGVAATPHFYAWQSSPEQFFEKRQAAWEKLKSCLGAEAPEIRLGAEVQYFEGIHRYDGLEQFCLEGTDLLLVEMPECTWTMRMASAILDVKNHKNVTVLLAHIERYLPYGNMKLCEQLLEHGILMQASTGFFIEKRRTAMKMLREGKIHFIGTDSHNMDGRKPNLAQALEIISHKKGAQLLEELKRKEAMVLNETERKVDNFRYSGGVADMLAGVL